MSSRSRPQLNLFCEKKIIIDAGGLQVLRYSVYNKMCLFCENIIRDAGGLRVLRCSVYNKKCLFCFVLFYEWPAFETILMSQKSSSF